MDSSFNSDVLRRLPLAEAVLTAYQWALDDSFLADIWKRFRGRCYEKLISFSSMVSLVFDALVCYGSGRQAFHQGQQREVLVASMQAAYQKLGKLPLKLSEAFLSGTTDRLLQILPDATPPAVAEFPSLAAFRPMILDGKAVKQVPRRLLPLRRSKKKCLGGKALVALDHQRQLAMGMATSPDGETNEASLVPALVADITSRVAEPLLWIGDRQFFGLGHAKAFTARAGDHFLVRYNATLPFTPDPDRAEQQGVDRHGRKITQEWGWIGKEKNPQRRYVRRLRVHRDGEDLVLMTSLLETTCLAEELLELYFRRWGIERVFQKITEVFDLRQLIGTTAQATMFQLAFCLMLYNLMVLVASHVIEKPKPTAKDPEKKEKLSLQDISLEMLFEDVRRQLISVETMMTSDDAIEILEPIPTAAQVRRKLRALLASQWDSLWRKTNRKRGRPIPTANKDRPSKHRSVFRLIKEYKELQAKRKRKLKRDGP